MYLVAKSGRRRKTMREHTEDREHDAEGLAGWLLRWWRQRSMREVRRQAKRQMFILETLVLGPKQRMVLMRCGSERFLVGTGSEGIQSVVRVADAAASGEERADPSVAEQWG
jgi:flagellar biogenesis protein FliO